VPSLRGADGAGSADSRADAALGEVDIIAARGREAYTVGGVDVGAARGVGEAARLGDTHTARLADAADRSRSDLSRAANRWERRRAHQS